MDLREKSPAEIHSIISDLIKNTPESEDFKYTGKNSYTLKISEDNLIITREVVITVVEKIDLTLNFKTYTDTAFNIYLFSTEVNLFVFQNLTTKIHKVLKRSEDLVDELQFDIFNIIISRFQELQQNTETMRDT
jgi:hypothetical protein